MRVIGEAAALTDALSALRALVGLAEAARDVAREADLAASRARETAANREREWQHEAFLERRSDRVLAIGQVVEELFWAIAPFVHDAGSVDGARWMPYRNQLRHMMVGLTSELPNCARILDAGTAGQAFDSCVLGRQEVEVELDRINHQLASLREAPPS